MAGRGTLDVDTEEERRRRRRAGVPVSAEDTGAGALTPGMRQSMGAAGACFGGESEEQGVMSRPCIRLSSRTCRCRRRRAFESTPHSVALTQALSVGDACKCVRTREKESARARQGERACPPSPAFERGGVLSLSSVFLFAFVCARERRLRRCLGSSAVCDPAVRTSSDRGAARRDVANE